MNEEKIKKAIESVQSKTMNTMSYNDSLKLEKYIERLQHEIKLLKENRPIENKAEYFLNELESWLEERIKDKTNDIFWDGVKCGHSNTLHKLKELKGSNKNE